MDPILELNFDDDLCLPPVSLVLPLFPPSIKVQEEDYTRTEQLQLVAYATELYRRYPRNEEGCDLMDQFRRGLSTTGQMHALAQFGHWARQASIPSVKELFWGATVTCNCTLMLARMPNSKFKHWQDSLRTAW
jgi:hypothetical protein